MKLYFTETGLDNISTWLTGTAAQQSGATFTETDVMEKDYSNDQLDQVYGFIGEWSSATSDRKKEIIAILNSWYVGTSIPTTDDIDDIYHQQIITARDNYTLGGIV